MTGNKILQTTAICFLTSLLAMSCATAIKKHTIGQTAAIEVVEAGLAFKARLDTGAKRTSIHAVNIHVNEESEVMAENTDKAITFKVINENNEEGEITTRIKDVSRVRNSQGKEFSYVVDLESAWQGVSKKVEVNLRNREKMTYKLLIGRNWLENDFVVDVAHEIPHDADDIE